MFYRVFSSRKWKSSLLFLCKSRRLRLEWMFLLSETVFSDKFIVQTIAEYFLQGIQLFISLNFLCFSPCLLLICILSCLLHSTHFVCLLYFLQGIYQSNISQFYNLFPFFCHCLFWVVSARSFMTFIRLALGGRTNQLGVAQFEALPPLSCCPSFPLSLPACLTWYFN